MLLRRPGECSRKSTRRWAKGSADTIWNGPAETLTLTENAQPALMAVSLAALRVLEAEAGVDLARDAAFVAGHSLGEYSALAAARSLTIADAARLLRIRGRAMQKAVPVGAGAMAALIGVDLDDAKSIAAEAAASASARPRTTMAAGRWSYPADKAAVERAVEIAKATRRETGDDVAGVRSVPLLRSCSRRRTRWPRRLPKVAVKPPRVPLVANVLARPITRSGRDRALA